ncbi:MAG: hypothetical protein WCS80_02115 [Bacilli bacterium]
MNNNAEYSVDIPKRDPWLIVILVFLGWFGIDKFYVAKTFKKTWKFALVKFAYSLVLVGILWNIFDIIQAIRNKYQFDFREYFR